MANNKITGDSNIKYGNKRLLNLLKNRIFFFNFELNNKIKSGPNPIMTINIYLTKISNEYLPKLP
tara:strand:+ start:690 stop:884 length:195 start_codon:yes stop_codon:yes gene_type:complete